VPSDLKLTAEQIGELEGIVATDYYGHAEIGRLQKLLPALIAAAKATTSAEQRAVAAEGRVKELAQALGSMLYICGQRLMVANPRNDTHGHKYAEQVIAEGKAVIARTALAQPPEELYRTELENDELNRQQANRQIQEENP